jgi:hypothetical protein
MIKSKDQILICLLYLVLIIFSVAGGADTVISGTK